MIGWLIGNVLQVIPDLFISDEEAKRAAKAGLWATIAAVSAPLDPASTAGASILAGSHLAAAASDDEGVTSTIDAAGSALSGTVNASPLELAKVISFGAAGAAAGGSSGEKGGVASGFRLGTELGSGSIDQVLAKSAGAMAGGSAGAALSSDDERFRAVELGARMGMGLASNVASLDRSDASLQEDRALKGERPLEEHEFPGAAEDARRAAVASLVSRAGGLAIGGALRDSMRKGSLIDALETGSSLGGSAGSAVHAIGSGEAPLRGLGAIASLGSAVIDAVPLEDSEASVARLRRDEELRAARRRANEEAKRRAALRELLERSAALVEEIGS